MEIAVGSKPGAAMRGLADAHVAEMIGRGVVLLAVAEGFGLVRGHGTPYVAVSAVRDALRRRVRPDGRDARAALIAALSAANARVFAHSGSHDDFVASGTSLSVALIVGDRAHIAHVGRTRAYLCRDDALTALTVDDELDAMTGHLLTRTLGAQATLEATISAVRLMPGDALVLATGAFHATIGEDEIAATLRMTASSESVTQRLLESGRMRGGDFAGTVIVGRALTDARAESGGRGFNVQNASLALTILVLFSLVAATIFHAVLGP